MMSFAYPLPVLRRIAPVLVAGLWAAAATTQASPVTYRFEMPAWSFPVSQTVFGTHAVLDVALDNGASSNVLQSYLNADIRLLRVWTVGGTLDLSFTQFTSFTGGLSASFISTDASGHALLDLLARPASPDSLGVGIYGMSGMGTVQLAQMTPTGGLSTFAVSLGGDVGLVLPMKDFEFLGLSVNGQLLDGGQVPEPSSWALGGLACLAAVWVRRAKKV